MASPTSSPVKTKGPPPPVPKKPAFLKELPNPPPKILPTPPTELLVPPKDLSKINNKLTSSLRDELNRKLAAHLTLPTPNRDSSRSLNLPKTPPKSSAQTKVNIKGELENLFAKQRNENTFKDDRVVGTNQQHGVESSISATKMSTLTHVTKMNPRDASDLDNTLDFSLTDNPFDGVQSHGDDLNTHYTNDDDYEKSTEEYLDDLPMVLPPPDMCLFDGMSEGSQEQVVHEDFNSPDLSSEDEAYDVDVFIPPPPPPAPQFYDSDEESCCHFGQIPEYVDDESGESDEETPQLDNDKTLVESEQNVTTFDIETSTSFNTKRPESDEDDDTVNNINEQDNSISQSHFENKTLNQSSFDKVVNQSESLMRNIIQSDSDNETFAQSNASSKDLNQSTGSEKVTSISIAQRRLSFENNCKKDLLNINSSSTENELSSGRSTPSKTHVKSPPIIPSITPVVKNPLLANNLNHILKRQLSNPGTPLKLSDFKKVSSYESDNNNITSSNSIINNNSNTFNSINNTHNSNRTTHTSTNITNYKTGSTVTSGRSTPAPEMDSGFSTARSVDGSLSDRNNNNNNQSKHKLEESLFTALPAVDKKMDPEEKSPVSNRVSRTFSSSSESSSLSDDEENAAPKMNLRNLLLKHMRSADSDSFSDEDLNLQDGRGPKLEMRDLEENSHYGADIETRLNEVDVVDWRVEDVCEWLELIGFSYLKTAFAKKMVSGKMLINSDLNILDQIRFDNPEDREIIQSEISALQMTNDEEMEMAILDALDKAAHTQDKNGGGGVTVNGNLNHLENGGLRRVESGRNMRGSKIPLRTPNVTLDETTSRDFSADFTHNEMESNTSKEDLRRKLGADVYDPDEEDAKRNDMTDSNDQLKVKKKSKKKGFFSSLRKKGSKRDQSPLADDQMQAIVQSNPKGMVTIGYVPINGGNEMEIKLLISMNTCAREVCNLCLDYLGLNEDLLCFFLVVLKKNKKGQHMDLNPSDPPLMFQCKWGDDEKHRFELKHKYDGQIVVNSENTEQQEMVTCRLGVSSQSTVKDIIPVLLKVFKEKEDRKYFTLVQGDTDTRISENSVLLDLPLNGQKNHIFKLVNSSPSSLNQRKISYNDAKKVDTKVSLLEKQVDKLSTLNEEYRRSEEHLSKENEKLSMEMTKKTEEVIHKSNDVKALQDQISSLTQKLRLSASSPLNDHALREENEKNKKKVTEQQYMMKNLEQSMKSLKESKSHLERELEEIHNKCQKLENSNEQFMEQLEQMKEDKRTKVSDNTEQMNKLYTENKAIKEELVRVIEEQNNPNKNELTTNEKEQLGLVEPERRYSSDEYTQKLNRLYIENKEYLKGMRNLEDKLAETEQRLAEYQLGHDAANSEEHAELRKRIDVLDSSNLAKDTRILEFEYKMSQKDRDLKDMRDQWEDECRKNRKEVELRETAESRCEDMSIKTDNIRLALSEKESQLQNFKAQNTKLEKKLNKQKYMMENERNARSQETHESLKRHQEELSVLLEKVQNGDKLLAENDLAIKQLAFDLTKDKEDLSQINSDLEKKLVAKDIILDRLESKIAKADLNLSSKLQEQEDSIRTKDEKVQRVELEMARLENEHAAKTREMANSLRTKDGVISKMEARFRKLEMSSGDNVKKFEKYVSEKDRLLQQVTSDQEKTSKDLKLRVRELEDTLNEKDKKLREAMRQYSEVKSTTDSRLKKREKEYKRQKFLLEKVLKLVSDKAPSLLRQLHESLDSDNASLDNMKSNPNSPREGVIHDEWC